MIHSFFIPEFLFKRDVFPLPEKNDQDHTWAIDQIDREGAFVGRCAELCGSYHSQMNFEVRALSPDKFDRWIEFRKQVNPATGAPYTAGEALAAAELRRASARRRPPPPTRSRPTAPQRSASEPPNAAGS